MSETIQADAASPLSLSSPRSGLRLRPQTSNDAEFLKALYVTIRWSELEPLGWPDEAKCAFLVDQFRLQTEHYAKAYYDAEFSIVEYGGEAIGRLYLFRGQTDHRVVDISLSPHACGKGFGTTLLKAVQAEAAAVNKTVSIHVEQFNPAQRLYRRLGFLGVHAEGPYLFMRWQPVP